MSKRIILSNVDKPELPSIPVIEEVKEIRFTNDMELVTSVADSDCFMIELGVDPQGHPRVVNFASIIESLTGDMEPGSNKFITGDLLFKIVGDVDSLETMLKDNLVTAINYVNFANKQTQKALDDEIERSTRKDDEHDSLIASNRQDININATRIAQEVDRATREEAKIRQEIEDYKDYQSGVDNAQDLALRQETESRILADQGIRDDMEVMDEEHDSRLKALEKLSHEQNTDTGTSSQTFQLQAKSGGVKIKNEDGTFSVRNGADTAYANATLKDLLVKGNLVVEGESTIIKAQTVEVADNLLLLNDGETGAGVTKGMSGIAVDRGTLADYMFVFDESDGAFKVGEENSLQIVATRGTEGEMKNGMFTSWNSSTLKLETTNKVPTGMPLTFGNSNVHGSYDLKIDSGLDVFKITYNGMGNNNTFSLNIDMSSDASATKITSTKGVLEITPALKLVNSTLHVPASVFHVNGNGTEMLRITPGVGVTSASFFRKKDDSEVLYHADIVNNVTSGGADKVLSAEQGKSLKELIDSVDEDLSSNYLPLSGGTMTGRVDFSVNQMISFDKKNFISYSGTDNPYLNIGGYELNSRIFFLTSQSDLIHYRKNSGAMTGTGYKVWDAYNLPHPAELDKDNVFTGSVTAGSVISEGLITAKSGVQLGTTADDGWYPDGVRLAAGISNARGVNVGNLLVSNAWSDYTKVPTNGAYIKGKAIVDTLEISRSIDDDVAQITFSKAGKNYICAPEGGSFAFVPDGKESSAYQLLIEGDKITMGQASSNTSMEVNGTISSSGLIKAGDGIQIGSTADYGWYLGSSGRIVAGMNTARNVSIGNLLVSDNYPEYAKVPVNGIYSKGSIVSGGPVVSEMGMIIANGYTVNALNSEGTSKRLIGKASNNTTYVGDIDGSMALYTAESDLIHHRNGSNYTVLDSYNYQRFITVPKWTYGFVGMSIASGQTVDLNTALEGDSNPKAIYNYNAGSSWVNGPGGMTYGSVIRLLSSQYYSTGSLFPQFAFDISAHDVTENSTGKFWFRTPNNKGLAAANWKRVLTESDTLINFPVNVRIQSSSDLYIGNSSNSGWVKMQNVCSMGANDAWNIRVDGTALFQVKVKSNAFTDIDGVQSLIFNTKGANFIKSGGVVNVAAGGLITAVNYDDIAYLPESGIYSRGVIRTNEYYLAGRAHTYTNGQWGYGFSNTQSAKLSPIAGLGTLYSSGVLVMYRYMRPKNGSLGWESSITSTGIPSALALMGNYLMFYTAGDGTYTEGETVTPTGYRVANYESDGTTFNALGQVNLKNNQPLVGANSAGSGHFNLANVTSSDNIVYGSISANNLYFNVKNQVIFQTGSYDIIHLVGNTSYKVWDARNLPQPLYMNYSNPYFTKDININVPNAGSAGWARALVWRTNTTETQAALGATGNGSSVNYAYLGVATGKLYNSTNQLRVYEDKVTFNGKKLLTDADLGLDDYLPLSAGSGKALTGTLFAPYGINIKNDVGLRFGIDSSNSNYLAALYSYNGVLRFGYDWTTVELGSTNSSHNINVLSYTIFNYGKRYNGIVSGICTDVYSCGIKESIVTGTMAITIPNKGNSTMCIFEIDIYNYVTNSHSRYIISGYPYNGNTWVHAGVTRIGTPVGNVRLAYDSDGNPVILIGTISSVWNYPAVYINKVLVSYTGRTANWQSGYSISYLTDETGLSVKNNPAINGGGVTSDAGFRSVARVSNINYEKKGNDVLHVSSFVTGATGIPGTDSISQLQVNDGVALTYFWSSGGDLAFQLACDIDGTGMAYRYYTPSTGVTVRGWNFLATTGWVNNTFAKKTDVGDFLTKTTADGYYASKSIFTTTSNTSTLGYPVINSLGNELVIYNNAQSSKAGDMIVNYRTITGKYAPRDWYFRDGNGNSSFANGYWGNLYMNNSIVATREWVEDKGYMTSTSIASAYLPLSGGTLTGKLIAAKGINLNNAGMSANEGISFYSTSYVTWYEYMVNTGNGTACTGGKSTGMGNVTGWTRRSTIENSTGYGWVWDSCTNTANVNPTPMMSLSSVNGNLYVKGDVYIAGSTDTNNRLLSINMASIRYADINKYGTVKASSSSSTLYPLVKTEGDTVHFGSTSSSMTVMNVNKYMSGGISWYVPSEWRWYNGKSTSTGDYYADGYWGDLYTNNKLVATQEWIENQAYLTKTLADKNYSPLTTFRKDGEDGEITLDGTVLLINTRSVVNNISVNARTPTGLQPARNWSWFGGDRTVWADGYWGDLYMDRKLVATQEWVNSQGFVTSTSSSKVVDIQIVDDIPSTQETGVLYLKKKS